MPFRSKAQLRLFAIKEDKGELPKGTFARFLKETKSVSRLPERLKRRKK
jgi:hypothetical protein